MKVLGLDLETQGLEDSTKITEIGATLVNFGADGAIFTGENFEAFCYEDDYQPQPEHIVKLTKITDAMLKRGGNPRRFVIREKLFPLMEKADLVIAHNVGFDKRILEATCKELNIPMLQKEWLCTRSDIDYGPEFSCRKLQHLAVDHGIAFDPKLAHRSLYDIGLMFNIVSHYKLEELLLYAREPWVTYQALVTPPWNDEGLQKGIASKLGFKWERVNVNYVETIYPKSWVLRAKPSKIEKIKKQVEASPSPFEIIEVQK